MHEWTLNFKHLKKESANVQEYRRVHEQEVLHANPPGSKMPYAESHDPLYARTTCPVFTLFTGVHISPTEVVTGGMQRMRWQGRE